MKVLHAIASAAALTLSLSGTAGAVDVHNPSVGDAMDNITLTITENGQPRTVTLASGETIFDICKECSIRAGDGNTVMASQHDMVEVSGSSARTYVFAKPGPQQAQRMVSDTSPTEDEMRESHDALATPENSVDGGDSD